MKRLALSIALLILSFAASAAQNVTVIGPITPGNCPQFSSTTVIKDSGFNCNGSPGGAITALTGDGTATGPGSVPFTLATVNPNVGSFGSATQCVSITTNGKGLITAASAVTCTPAVASITGLGTGVATALGNAVNASGGIPSPTPVRAGDIIYWNGSSWVTLAGNNSGSQVLSENSSGVPSWTPAGAGTVNSIAPGAGLVSSVTASCSQTAITTSGTLSAAECVNAQSGTTYTFVDGDRAKFVIATNASAMTYTLPQAGAASAFQSGWFVDVRNNTSAGATLTITPTTSTIDGAASVNIGQGASLRIVSDGTNYITKRGSTFIASFSNSLGSDVALNNTGNYFDGPSTAQGTIGGWFASGSVTLNSSGTDAINCKLWDGTTVIDSGRQTIPIASTNVTMALSGAITNPAGNIKISCNDPSTTAGLIKFNASGNSKDSTLTVMRIN